MNELINWVALNNTLMIRIGFSAVLLLVIAYAFSYFFVPRISVVTQAEEAAAVEEAAEKDPKQSSGEPGDDELARTAEIESLKEEIATLKAQVQAAPEPGPAAPPVTAGSAEMAAKIQSLEARLAEYEIIAEEIAEIGLLREENAELKARLAAGGAPAEPVAPAEAEPPASAAEPEPPVSEPTTADEPKYDGYEALSSPPEAEESRLVITSEVEVSEDEQALLNDFEEMIRKKG